MSKWADFQCKCRRMRFCLKMQKGEKANDKENAHCLVSNKSFFYNYIFFFSAQQQPVLEDSFNNPDSPVPPQSPAHVYYGQNYQQPMQKNQQQTQADPPQQPAFSCAGKVDGIYMQQPGACGSQFYKCSNAQAFSYNCTNGLVYNEQNNRRQI